MPAVLANAVWEFALRQIQKLHYRLAINLGDIPGRSAAPPRQTARLATTGDRPTANRRAQSRAFRVPATAPIAPVPSRKKTEYRAAQHSPWNPTHPRQS